MNAKAAAIGIVVANLSASIAFYQHFGLTFTGAEDPDGHAEADLGGGLRLMLDTEASILAFTSAWNHPSGSPRTTLLFQFDTPHDVDAKFAELMEAGYHGFRGPWDAPWGHRYASVIDPDGSGVDLFAQI